eukprot:10508755-Alexandrium_andersonii.AAC.1
MVCAFVSKAKMGVAVLPRSAGVRRPPADDQQAGSPDGHSDGEERRGRMHHSHVLEGQVCNCCAA